MAWYKNRSGFTLVELVVVLAIMGIVIAAAAPLSQTYLARTKMDEAIKNTVASLRYAQMQAMSETDDAAWGVNIDSALITIFQGASYATRTAIYDQTTKYSASYSVSGTSEFNFVKRTGRTTAGTVTFTDSHGTAKSVVVNELGTVDF